MTSFFVVEKSHLAKSCLLYAPFNLFANLFYPGIQFNRSLRKRGFVTVNFYTAGGEKKTVKGEPGETVMRIAQHNGIPLEGRILFVFLVVGACEGGMACATCHVIVGNSFFDKLPEASEEEEDCLDNATELTET